VVDPNNALDGVRKSLRLEFAYHNVHIIKLLYFRLVIKSLKSLVINRFVFD
jgi:hypothetical protein